jgi:hypothetical protein
MLPYESWGFAGGECWGGTVGVTLCTFESVQYTMVDTGYRT